MFKRLLEYFRGRSSAAKSIFAFLVALGLVSSASAQDNEFVFFESRSDGPFKLSVFQEIPGFRSSLAQLDKGRNILAGNEEWRSMVDTDIWVFFMKDRIEASLLPSFVLDILEVHYDGSRAFSIVGDVSIEGSLGEKLMYFVFIDDFGSHELSTIGCDTATILYFQLEGNEISDIRSARDECYAE